MRTFKGRRSILRATAVFVSIVLQVGVAYSVQSAGARRNVAEPTAIGDDTEQEPRDLKPEEKKRDYAVIEAALIDLTDPKSPINKNFIKNRGIAGKYIVLGPTTSRYYGCLSRESLPLLEDKEKGQTIPDEIADALRQRNKEQPASLKDFRTEKAEIRLRDVYEEFKGSFEPEFAGKFWEKYADSWGYVYAFLPGYSKDGKTAVVIFDDGPSPHGAQVTYLMVKTEQGWKIRWRNRYFWR
jgi:hypothetical protein